MTELDRMLAVTNESQAIGGFLDWLFDQGFCIAGYDPDLGDELFRESRSIEQWLADYYDIDLEEVERERRAFLKALRDAND